MPATPKIYRYKASYKQSPAQYSNQSPAQYSNQSPAQYNNNQAPAQYQNQAPSKNFQGQSFEGQNYPNQRFQGSQNQQYYSQPAQAPYNNQYNFNGQNNRQYAGSMPYTNNGEQVKLRRYQIYRPGIKKEFYDIEERTIVRPAGSALIELDPPTKKQDVTNYEPYGKNYGANNEQFNSKGYKPNQFGGSNAQNEQFYVPIQGIPDCGGYGGQTPVYEYGPPSTFDGPQTTYHPTTFHPPTTPTPQRPQTPPQRPQTPPQQPEQPQQPQTPTYPTYTPTTTPQRPTYPTYPTTTTTTQRPTYPTYPTTTSTQTPTYPTYHPSKTYQPPYTDSTYSSTCKFFLFR